MTPTAFRVRARSVPRSSDHKPSFCQQPLAGVSRFGLRMRDPPPFCTSRKGGSSWPAELLERSRRSHWRRAPQCSAPRAAGFPGLVARRPCRHQALSPRPGSQASSEKNFKRAFPQEGCTSCRRSCGCCPRCLAPSSWLGLQELSGLIWHCEAPSQRGVSARGRGLWRTAT